MLQSRKLEAKDFSEIYDIPKYILKEIAFEYLPSKVITRKKVGFPVPLNEWNDSLISRLETELKVAPWLRFHDLGRLMEECGKLDKGNQFLWMFLNIQLFIKNFFFREWRW